MGKQKNANKPLYIYKPSTNGMHFVQLLFVLMLLLPIPLLLSAKTSDNLLCLLPIVVGYELSLFLGLSTQTNQQALAIYEDGLEYRFRSTRIFSHWEDLQRFEIRGGNRSPIWGISTAKLEKHYGWNMFDRMYIGDTYTDFIPFSIVHLPTRIINPQQFEKTPVGYIPLPDNSERVVDRAKFAETKFGHELKHYAPQLFEHDNEKVKNS